MKITPKQEKLFKECVMKWQAKLGLQRYKIFTKTDAMKAIANMIASERDGVAMIAINEDLYEEHMDEAIDRAALHECLELLLHDICHMLEAHYSEEKVDTVIHRIIRTIEGILFES